MHTAPTEKRFWYYVLPSMLTMVLSGFYVIVDGFFIGQATGDIGLGAINLAWPITAVMQATGIGVGIGGSVLFSMYQGAQDDEEARAARGNTIVLLFLFSVFMMVFFWFTSDAILVLFGARGALFNAARDYIRVIIFGTLFQTFGCGLTPLIKNSGRAISAMLIMVSGLVTNMILDALFIMVFPARPAQLCARRFCFIQYQLIVPRLPWFFNHRAPGRACPPGVSILSSSALLCTSNVVQYFHF